jgi:hypothetical protein
MSRTGINLEKFAIAHNILRNALSVNALEMMQLLDIEITDKILNDMLTNSKRITLTDLKDRKAVINTIKDNAPYESKIISGIYI